MFKLKAFKSRKAIEDCVPEHRNRIRRLMQEAAGTDAIADSTGGASLPAATDEYQKDDQKLWSPASGRCNCEIKQYDALGLCWSFAVSRASKDVCTVHCRKARRRKNFFAICETEATTSQKKITPLDLPYINENRSVRNVSNPSTSSRNATPPPQPPQPIHPTAGNAQIAKVLERVDALSRRVVNIETTSSSNTTTLQDLKNTVTSMNERIINVETMTISIHKMLKELCNKQSPKARVRPAYLPFKTTADLLAFNAVSEEEYDDLVNYLLFVGGVNMSDAASRYFKTCLLIDADIFRQVTWTRAGIKTPDGIALQDTRFSKACLDALPINKETLAKPTKVEFTWIMTKALKNAKEAFRRKLKRSAQQLAAEEAQQNQPIQNVEPPRKRPRLDENQVNDPPTPDINNDDIVEEEGSFHGGEDSINEEDFPDVGSINGEEDQVDGSSNNEDDQDGGEDYPDNDGEDIPDDTSNGSIKEAVSTFIWWL